MKKFKLFFLYLLAGTHLALGQNDVIFKDSTILDPRMSKVLTPQEHFNMGTIAMEAGQWKKAVKEFSTLTRFHPNSQYTPDAYYYTGVCLYKINEYEVANRAFNNYMNEKSDPKFFEEAIRYKFSIAEHFRGGSKRRPFGTSELFKFLPAHRIALTIYDEVIAAMPSHDLAAQSLFFKGCLLWKLCEFRDAIEAYQSLTKRFPKHELTPQAYLNITKVYLDQSRSEFQNPDIISLAEVNLRKFRLEFPRDERIEQAEKEICRIKEVYAEGLFNTAEFYLRVEKIKAAIIYYENTIRQYPSTAVAEQSRNRLREFAPKILETLEKMMSSESVEEDLDPKSLGLEDLSGINFEAL